MKIEKTTAVGEAERCSISWCEKPSKTMGWCGAHYQRWRRHGDPLGGGIYNGQAVAWLLNVALTYESDSCLIWPFGRAGEYGSVYIDGEISKPHRWVCQRKKGDPTPLRGDVAHGCGNPPCVNYRHLRWANAIENAADRKKHGTACDGENHPMSKLTELDVVKIRRRVSSGETQKAVASDFNVVPSTVSLIVRAKIWAHVLEKAQSDRAIGSII